MLECIHLSNHSSGLKNSATIQRYSCTVTLVCDWDIRVYEIEARAYGKSTVLRLDFVVPARNSTVQEIPVHNPDPKEWVLQSSFSDCKYFSGPASILIPARQHANFPLVIPVLVFFSCVN